MIFGWSMPPGHSDSDDPANKPYTCERCCEECDEMAETSNTELEGMDLCLECFEELQEAKR